MANLFDVFRSMGGHDRTGEKKRILIAEDYVDLASVIALLLKHCGFDARTVHDGGKVLELARRFRPHFILLDIRMPGMSGDELAGQIRREAKLEGCVIIGISAYRRAPGSSIDGNFDHHLAKPFDFDSLLALLKLH